MNSRILNSIVFTALLSAGPCALAQSAKEISEIQAAAYTSAYEKGDASALAALFTPDAQYNVDTGDVVSGRAAIEKRSGEFLSSFPDAKIGIVVVSSRFLTPDVLTEKGFATVTGAGSDETSQYSATQINKDGKWLIAELQELTLPGSDAATEALSSLDWMIGKWKIDTGKITAEIDATWTLDGRFITRTIRIPNGDEEPFVSVEVIGYDPVQAKIRSWIFDNEGGFGSGIWRRDANKWLIRSKATLPGGEQSSSQHILTLLEDGRFTLETINRVLDGEMLPNRSEFEIIRVSEDQKPTSKK